MDEHRIENGSPRPLVVITQWVHDSVLALLEPHARLIVNPDRATLPETEVLRRCSEADAVMAFMSDRIDDRFLGQCPRLRVVAGALKGYDNIDVQACTSRGIWLSIVPDLLTVPTAELAIGLALALARHVCAGDRFMRQSDFGGWQARFYGLGMAHTRVGIVGFGAVGQAVAERLRGFGCSLRAHDREPKPASDGAVAMHTLTEVISWAELVIVCLPLTSATYRIIDDERLQQMQVGALLVNVGRGAVVDEEAVAEALATGRLGGYAADVFACEDRSLPDCPETIPERLLEQHDRTVLTPHLGSAVDRVREEIALAAAYNIVDCLQQKRPRDAINEVHGLGASG